MLQAHRQAWIWQDEWHGLDMEDIREIERQTQDDLKRKMGHSSFSSNDDHDDISGTVQFFKYFQPPQTNICSKGLAILNV